MATSKTPLFCYQTPDFNSGANLDDLLQHLRSVVPWLSVEEESWPDIDPYGSGFLREVTIDTALLFLPWKTRYLGRFSLVFTEQPICLLHTETLRPVPVAGFTLNTDPTVIISNSFIDRTPIPNE